MTRTLGISVLAFVLLGLGFDSYAAACDKQSEVDQQRLRDLRVRRQSGQALSKEEQEFVACMTTVHPPLPAPKAKGDTAPPPPPKPQPQPQDQAKTPTQKPPAGGGAPQLPHASPPSKNSPAPTAPAPDAVPCPGGDLAPFPWPDPPLPSGTAYIPRSIVSGQNETISLLDVGARLEGAITRAGYKQPKFLGAGCNGFVMVLDLEHIEADGKRMRGSKGFAPPSQEAAFNLAEYVKRLFYAPPGHYRQIVLVVSEKTMGRGTASPTEGELRAIARGGISSLPRAFKYIPYTDSHVISVLIYEFEKGPRDGDAKVNPPDGRLGATVHLMKSRLVRRG